MTRARPRQRGFTLVRLLIAVTITALLLAEAGAMLWTAERAYRRSGAATEREAQVQALLRLMQQDFGLLSPGLGCRVPPACSAPPGWRDRGRPAAPPADAGPARPGDPRQRGGLLRRPRHGRRPAAGPPQPGARPAPNEPVPRCRRAKRTRRAVGGARGGRRRDADPLLRRAREWAGAVGLGPVAAAAPPRRGEPPPRRRGGRPGRVRPGVRDPLGAAHRLAAGGLQRGRRALGPPGGCRRLGGGRCRRGDEGGAVGCSGRSTLPARRRDRRPAGRSRPGVALLFVLWVLAALTIICFAMAAAGQFQVGQKLISILSILM